MCRISWLAVVCALSLAACQTVSQDTDGGDGAAAESSTDAGAESGVGPRVEMDGGRSNAGADAAPASDAGVAVGDATLADAAVTDAHVLPDSSVASGGAADLRCHADASAPQRADYSKPGPHAVGSVEVTFQDESRPIAQSERHPAAPSRALVTTIYYPAQASAGAMAKLAQGGPFPMLMYSHGYSSSRSEATATANRAASYGYIVVAPDFPLTNLLANNAAPDVDDVVNQPGDVSFLIDRLLAFSKDSNHVLANGVDATRIGALGVSLGGLTTLLVTFHPKLRDPRIKVAMPIAALSSFFAAGFYHTQSVPLLFVHGDLDAFVNYQTNARRAFMRAASSARLLSVSKGTHAAFGAEFDAITVPILNALLGAPGADPGNPDGIGCGAVSDTLNMSGGGFLPALGGPENFISASEATLPPCKGDEYKQPGIDPQQQTDIMVKSASAFFDAHFAATPEQRQDGCRYLLYEMPKTPAVTLE